MSKEENAEPRNRCLGCRHDFAPSNRQAILDGSPTAALASGFGDHAELVEIATRCEEHWLSGPQEEGAIGVVVRRAQLEALLAENAALRDREKAALKECSDWARQAGEAIGKLETSQAAGIVEGWRDRATEAERKLAEAVTSLALIQTIEASRKPFESETELRMRASHIAAQTLAALDPGQKP